MRQRSADFDVLNANADLPAEDIFSHNYTGHPPQVHVSRELAQRGHTILYAYGHDRNVCGNLVRHPSDPQNLDIVSVENRRLLRASRPCGRTTVVLRSRIAERRADKRFFNLVA